MLRAKRLPDTWIILAEWVLVNLAGWAAGLTVGVLLTSAAAQLPWLNPDRFLVYALLGSVGLTTGLAQRLVVKRFESNSTVWFAATVGGYLLSLALFTGFDLTQPAVAPPWGDLILIGLTGAAVGLPQWWVLRRRFHSAGIWVPATAAGFLCFLWLTGHPAGSAGELVIVGAVLGALAAALPGLVLAWLAGRQAPSAVHPV